MDDGVVVYDADLRIWHANAAAMRRFGVHPLGPTTREAGSNWPEQAARIRAVLEGVRASGEAGELEGKLMTPAGERSIVVTAVPMTNHDGDFCGIAAIARDTADPRRIEDALREKLVANEQLAQIAASVPGAIFSYRLRPDGSSYLPFATRAIEDLSGLTREQLAQSMGGWFANMDPDERGRVKARIVMAAGAPAPWHDEFRYHHPTRGLRWFEGWSLPGPRVSGETTFHGFVMDVTDRKVTEERVVRLGRLYRVISATNEAIVRATDPDALLASLCEIVVGLGDLWIVWAGRHDAASNVLSTVAVAGDGAERVRDVRLSFDGSDKRAGGVVGTAFATGKLVVENDLAATEIPARWKGLSDPIGSMLALPLRRGGVLVGMIMIGAKPKSYFDAETVELFERVAEDVSFGLDAVERARELRESEERYRDLVDTSPDVIALIGLDKCFTFVNRAVERYGLDPASRVGGFYLRAIEPEDHPIVEAAWEAALAGRPAAGEARLRFPDGKLRHFRFQFHAVPFGGPPTGVRLIASDVTDQRAAEEQLRSAQKMEAIGRLAGGIAHDFNNILSVIGSYSDLAMSGLRPEDPLSEDIMEIRVAARRAASLTSQLLAFSRKQFLRPQVLDVDALVAGTSSMLRRLIGEDVDLVVVPSRVAAYTLADPGQLEQVLMNLAVNARDAMPSGGSLTIQTTATPGEIELTVKDTGTGMDAATKARIFEPFFTTKAVGEGTGLGLSTVYGIVEQSGGRVEVESDPGKGSTFRISLPRVLSAEGGVSPTSAVDTAPRGTETVLVVEDDDAVRRLVQRILVRAGYDVLVASNAGEALLLAEKRGKSIDLMLTDVVMPTMSGRELVDRMAEAFPGLKVLYMSGYTEDAVLHRGVRADGTVLISKPFTADELARRVRAALDATT